MRLLVVKTSSMGDVVHALPALTDMKAQVPGLEVHWLVEPAFAAIPALHPGVAQVHRLPWRKWRKHLLKPATWAAMGELKRTLREARFDAVLDLQGLLKSALWARQAGAPVWGYAADSAREPWATRLYARCASVPKQMQAVQRSRELAGALLGYAVPDTPADFGLGELPPLQGLPPRYAVLVPNASRPEKFWPEDDWIRMGRHLKSLGWTAVVLWGSAAEEAMARRIAEGCEGHVPPFLTVSEAAQLLAGAAVVIGLDTGFSHLAAALGRPVVGIYCDHDPGLAGMTGSGGVRSVGGKGQRPNFDEVLQLLDQVRPAAA